MYKKLKHREDLQVAVIGAGGIGSHLCRLLDKMICEEQLPFEAGNVNVYDFDIVENKNTKHQDYTDTEVGVPKAVVMSVRYGFNAYLRRFSEKDTSANHIFIICADNPDVRRIVFEAAYANGQPFVDLRSEGDMYAVFTEKMDKQLLMSTLGADPNKQEGVSCQLVEDQANNVIRLGNFMVPVIGVEILQTAFRGGTYPAKIVRSVI